MVAWHSSGSSGGDFDGYSVQGQHFNPSGTPTGIQFQVNTDGVVTFDGPDFSTLPTGYGLALDSRGRLQNGAARSSYMVGAQHAVTVCNGNTEGSEDSTYQVFGATQRNTFVDATGEPSGDPPDGETTIFSPRSTLKGVPALP